MTKATLKQGGRVFFPEINRIFSPKIVDILGCLGYGCVWIDMEHSDLRYDEIYQMATSGRAADMDVIVRVNKGDYSRIIKPLEAGVNGLVLPHCMNAQDARDFVRMAKFQPMGLRAMGAGRDSDFGMACIPEWVRQANEETLLIVMIEDKEAIDNIDGIAAVEGVDVLFVGPGDLSQSLGVTGQMDHPLIVDAMQKVSAASEKHGKAWGSVPLPESGVDVLMQNGARFISAASDLQVLISGYQAAKKRMEEVFGV
jgi:2-keto-3-deoxy-L-rhamnonate aldolase RhmA